MKSLKRVDGRTYSVEAEDTSWSTDLLTDDWDTLSLQVTQVETSGSLDVDWDILFSNNGDDWVDSGITTINLTGDDSDVFLSVGVTSRYVRVTATVNDGEGDLSFKVNAKSEQQ